MVVRAWAAAARRLRLKPPPLCPPSRSPAPQAAKSSASSAAAAKAAEIAKAKAKAAKGKDKTRWVLPHHAPAALLLRSSGEAVWGRHGTLHPAS